MKLITVLATPMFTFKRENFANPDRVSISYLDFDITRFGIESPIEINIPSPRGLPPGSAGRYHRCRMTYGGHPFALKIPNVHIYNINRPRDGLTIEGLFVGFTATLSPNEVKFIQVIDSIYKAMIPYLKLHRGAVKMFDFTGIADTPSFKSPLYYPRDKMTGDLIPNKNPGLGLKVKKGTLGGESTILKSSVDDHVLDLESLKAGMVIEDPEVSLSGFVGGARASIPIRLVRGYAEVMPE